LPDKKVKAEKRAKEKKQGIQGRIRSEGARVNASTRRQIGIRHSPHWKRKKKSLYSLIVRPKKCYWLKSSFEKH